MQKKNCKCLHFMVKKRKAGGFMLRRLLVFLLFLFMLSACQNNESGSSPAQSSGTNKSNSDSITAEVNLEPVNVLVGLSVNWLGEGEIDRYFIDAVKTAYPHITVDIIDINAPENNEVEKLVISGNVPDIFMTASPIINRFTGFGLEYDMETLIKEHQFDLSRLNSVAVDSVKTAAQTEHLIGLPWTMHFSALYYNKGIFDLFGVEYPDDGMTWNELYDLAVRLTRKDGDVQYRGLEPDIPPRLAPILSIEVFDGSGKANVTTDEWQKVFELAKRFYDIPGNENIAFTTAAWNQFAVDQTLAMYPTLNYLPNLKDVEGLDWDIAQYPSFEEKPNVGMMVDMWILHITNQSKHKDAAFKVIETILSDEVQLELSKNARFPIAESEEIREVFGMNMPHLAGKHLEAAFLSEPAPALPVTEFDAVARWELEQAMAKVAKEGVDINTALRQAEEIINQEVASQSN